MFDTILAAIDGSARDEHLLDTVAYLARTSGANVYVAHADESMMVYDAVVDLADDALARKLVCVAVERLRETGVVADGSVLPTLYGDVPQLLADRARAVGADLIALGPRHHGRLGALAGSVSSDVSRLSVVSVLLVQ
ncbi:universal stress protein [Catellatospora sichuanensis]|uniref:universal stress protein n=1 Tax=Catellatospora sichuanensis TaxID=1969805 RepID=UPI001642D699|nr:universal stress protein [Catellatospora sichuanensis]